MSTSPLFCYNSPMGIRDYKKVLEGYVESVLEGKTAAGFLCRKACARHKRDVKKQEKADYPFYFDVNAAAAACAFAEELKPPDLNGGRLSLLPWQVFCVASLEGWRHKGEDTRRRFRSAYIEVARKNGKTTGLLLPLILYNFLRTRSAESYIVSSRDDLSEKTFKEVAAMIRADSRLDSCLDCKSLSITFKDKRDPSRLAFFCDGGKSVDGFRPSFFCIDEYHEYPTDKMLDSLTFGMRSRRDAQGVIITTADVETAVPCYEQRLKAQRVLAGTQSQEDFFCVVYCVDEGDDWRDPATWQKANPSLGEIIDPAVIESDIENAELTPHKLPELKAKTFGIWGGGGERSWMPMEVWQKNSGVEADFSLFEGKDCFGGLDLAQVDDICAFSLLFIEGGRYYYKHRFYIPESTVAARYRKENVNFPAWVEQGIVTATPGTTVDYSFIVRDILEDAARYRVLGIGFDKWQAKNVIAEIDAARPDILLVEIDQSLRKMSPLAKSFEKRVKDGEVIDNNPCQAWMVSNCEVRPDANGNYKPLKKSKGSTGRIDGVIAAIMALGVAESEEFAGKASPVDWATAKAMLL